MLFKKILFLINHESINSQIEKRSNEQNAENVTKKEGKDREY